MKSVSTAITELSEAIAGIQQLIEISQKYHEHHSLDKFVNIEGEPQEQTVERLEKFLFTSISLYSDYSTVFIKNRKYLSQLSIIYENLYDEIQDERRSLFYDCAAIEERLEKLKKELNIDQDRIVADGLTVNSFTGRDIKVVYNPKMSIMRLKVLIQEKEGIPPVEQRVIFAMKQLDEEKTLDDYNIKPNDTVYLILGLKSEQ